MNDISDKTEESTVGSTLLALPAPPATVDNSTASFS